MNANSASPFAGAFTTIRAAAFLSASTLLYSAVCGSSALATPGGEGKRYLANVSEDANQGFPSEVSVEDEDEDEDDGRCLLTKISVREFNWVGGVRLEPFVATAHGETLSCLQDHIDTAIDRCKSAMHSSLWWRDVDDCVILGYFMHVPQVVDLFGLQDVALRPAEVTGALAANDWYFRKHSCSNVCQQGTVYFDDDCNTVANPTTRQLAKTCDGGRANWATPISLIWDRNVDVDSEISFVQFPLEPGKIGGWYSWKASDATPLLVYDPEHRGSIVSGSQLFGSWTFGGKARSASLLESPVFGAEPWSDGFEALATLDRDRDGALTREELAPLGLWFDKNRDGVSQAGEVVSLRSAGVTRLSTTSDRRDAMSGTIFATDGFERRDGEKLVRGALADWRGEPGSDKAELIVRQTMREMLTPGASRPDAESTYGAPRDRKNVPEISSFDPHVHVSGLWRWKIVSDDAGALSEHWGVFGFSEREGGEITGHSIIEAPVQGVGDKVSRMVQVMPFAGTKTLDTQGRPELAFTLPGPHKKWLTENTAALSPDGSKLEGKSSTEIEKDGRKIKFTYRWIAERITTRPRA